MLEWLRLNKKSKNPLKNLSYEQIRLLVDFILYKFSKGGTVSSITNEVEEILKSDYDMVEEIERRKEERYVASSPI